MNIISEKDWKHIFEIADKAYTYKDFLRAVYKFPKFCGEKGPYANTSLSLEDICKI